MTLLPTLILAIIIGALLIERHFMVKQNQQEKDKLLEELSRAVKAVISKNANEYVMTTSIDKVAPEVEPPREPDLVPEETLSDEEFMQALKKPPPSAS